MNAQALLTRVLDSAESHGRGGSLLDARLARALAHEAAGATGQAMADLAAALAHGVPAGYARVFLDEGPPMERLLRAAAARADCGEHARLLLSALAVSPATTTSDEAGAATGPATEEKLSAREVEVLRLLASDLSGPEIARQLFVSINTLRTHTKHIFTKLDVRTRRAAVRRAAELDLL